MARMTRISHGMARTTHFSFYTFREIGEISGQKKELSNEF